MKTAEYLDAVKVALGIESDYALAKALSVSKNAVRNWNNGICGFNEATAHKVAGILKMHPGIVILDSHREHAKDDQTRALWQEIFKGFRVLLSHAKLGQQGYCPA